MNYLKIILPYFIFIVLFGACKKENELPVDMGYKYFPINIGHWVVYNVDSISYNDFTGNVDSFNFQIKEYVESVFYDNEGRETQRLERYKRDSDTSQWVIKDVWFINLTETTAEKTEENIRFVKLIFPPTESGEWNGNSFNSNGLQTYKYLNLYTPYHLNNLTFDSTISVLQKQESTLISEKQELEVYAAHVGMVYKKYVDLTKEPTGIITEGVDYSYTLMSFGN